MKPFERHPTPPNGAPRHTDPPEEHIIPAAQQPFECKVGLAEHCREPLEPPLAYLTSFCRPPGSLLKD